MIKPTKTKLKKAIDSLGIGNTRGINIISSITNVSAPTLFKLMKGEVPKQKRVIDSLNEYFEKAGV